MVCIKRLTDEDFGLNCIPLNNPRERIGARGIVLNSENKIAILNKKVKNEYKLIGGGVEEFEDPIKAFKREVLEETGCEIEIDDCIGTIHEIKSHDNFRQISYVYLAHVINEGKPNYTKEEQGEGATLLWLKIDEAMKVIQNCENDLKASPFEENEKSIYHTKFIVRRDYEILNYYKKHYI